jgi:hypothetical protein
MAKATTVSQKGLRTPERMFRAVLWIVAIIFAGFLIGLGSLVVRDLPKVDASVTLGDFIDKSAAGPIDAAMRDAELKVREARDARASLQLKFESAQSGYDNAKRGFDNWVATRQSTQRADQDPEVIKRTRDLDELAAATRSAQTAVEQQQSAQLAAEQSFEDLQRRREALDEAARETYETALRQQELHVFLIRLAVTLPPLAIAGWLFVKHRRSNWWPFVWGFVFFAMFTFFVELVPYLPSYGGYVRYLVGIAITFAVGRYAIVAMQRYLERQRVAEEQSESVRRQSVSYEHAIKSVTAGVCPGCERGYKVHEGQTNFCMHCGMKLFDHCAVCSNRKNAFFHFCPSCGADKPEAGPPDPAIVTAAA